MTLHKNQVMIGRESGQSEWGGGIEPPAAGEKREARKQILKSSGKRGENLLKRCERKRRSQGEFLQRQKAFFKKAAKGKRVE